LASISLGYVAKEKDAVDKINQQRLKKEERRKKKEKKEK